VLQAQQELRVLMELTALQALPVLQDLRVPMVQTEQMVLPVLQAQ
jgi:hypothetical protein